MKNDEREERRKRREKRSERERMGNREKETLTWLLKRLPPNFTMKALRRGKYPHVGRKSTAGT